MPLFESQSVTVERDTDGSAVLKLDVPGRSMNVFARQVFADLDAALDAVMAAGKLPVLIVRSGKKSGFLAGADLSEFLAIQDAASAQALSESGQKLFDKVAALPMPTIAAIHGPCLGGGLEFALACDYRLVFDRPGTQIGFPEVELGLLPGWGGTQRLPRAIGLERALQVILAGKRLNAREAFTWGLADALAATEAELRDQFTRLTFRAVQCGKRRSARLPLTTWRQRLLESNPIGRRILFQATERILRSRVPDDMPAPAEALEAIRVGLKQGMTAGLAYEREAAGRLAVSSACRNLIGLFFQREKARKLPETLAAASPGEVRRVGVVGAGVMGAGIAQLAAFKGAAVVVQEVNQAALDAGLGRIQDLFQKAVERRLLTEAEAQQRRMAVKGTLNWEGFDSVDVVVEAAIEDLDAKRALFRELDTRTPPSIVLATNTSSLLVEHLQQGLKHPERLAGLHFFNPVHRMPLVEVAHAPASEPRAVAVLTQWAIHLGKTPVLVKDSPGFVVNRILMPYLNEASLLVSEGLKIEDVDRVMKRFGMPMGPLELLDQVGLDVAAHVARSMQPVLADRFETNMVFEKMQARGWLGVKSGRGFYVHKEKALKVHTPAQELLQEEQPPGAALMEALPPVARLAQARERMVLLMVNEAASVLQEGVAGASDIDLAMVLGTGWAPHRGGPLHYADQRGLIAVVHALAELTARQGRRFEPCLELKHRNERMELFLGPASTAPV
jgi:3-hydroxyacyl-CoA dehydrogenase/enoyl-CoA hydratase/3-hydroxybutyryl-CoA epimerase